MFWLKRFNSLSNILLSSQVSKLPKWNEYPSVFFSPENKGFDVAKMMSEGIGIPLEFPAPLPWLPPTCKPFTGRDLIQIVLRVYSKKQVHCE